MKSTENLAKMLDFCCKKLDFFAKKVGLYTGGMKRRVALARALAFESEALLLDEPFKGMDEDLMQRAADLIKSQNKITVVSTHSEAEARALGAEIVRLH